MLGGRRSSRFWATLHQAGTNTNLDGLYHLTTSRLDKKKGPHRLIRGSEYNWLVLLSEGRMSRAKTNIGRVKSFLLMNSFQGYPNFENGDLQKKAHEWVCAYRWLSDYVTRQRKEITRRTNIKLCENRWPGNVTDSKVVPLYDRCQATIGWGHRLWKKNWAGRMIWIAGSWLAWLVCVHAVRSWSTGWNIMGQPVQLKLMNTTNQTKLLVYQMLPYVPWQAEILRNWLPGKVP